MKALASKMEWVFIGGPEDPTVETKLTKQARAAFTEHTGHEWTKKMGGKKYRKDLKICGHHVYDQMLLDESPPKRQRVD